MRNISKFFLVILFLLNSKILTAEIVNQVEIIGNKRVSDETIKVYGEIDNNKKDYLKINKY